MKKIIYILIGLIMCGTVLYGEVYDKEIELDGDVKSIGFYEYVNSEEAIKLTVFEYKDKFYVIDYKNRTDDNLYSFGDFKCIEGKNTIVIGFWNNPGGDTREICIIKIIDDKLKVLGAITAGETGSFVEVKTPKNKSPNINRWKLEDFDNDGKEEILIYLVNIGYLFIEISDNELNIDYNPKNYLKINKMITDKKEYETNQKFINCKIDKKEIEKMIKVISGAKYDLNEKEVK